MLLRWFHNTIRLTFCCKVKKKIREIQIKKTDEQNKIYGFAYPVFRYSIEYSGSYQHGYENTRQATKSALTGIKKQTKEKSYEKYIRSDIML